MVGFRVCRTDADDRERVSISRAFGFKILRASSGNQFGPKDKGTVVDKLGLWFLTDGSLADV
jgi:hypothetical protein